MNIKRLVITTLADGTFAGDEHLTGEVIAVGLVLGTSTSLDLTLTDGDTGESVFAKTSITANNTWEPRRLATTAAGVDVAAAAGPPAVDNLYIAQTVFRTLHVAVANGGDRKTVTVYVAYRG